MRLGPDGRDGTAVGRQVPEGNDSCTLPAGCIGSRSAIDLPAGACAFVPVRSKICQWDSAAPPTRARRQDHDVKLLERVLNPREIRRRLGLNQEQFWTQIGVTQSGGSRYESGREMPKPVRELLRLVHVEQIDLSQVKRVDFEIISYLKESHPDLYRSLRRAVRSRHRTGVVPPLDLADGDEADNEGATGTQAANEPRG
jgi:DNA-binding transcriptional regulator YiaG